jgi:Domain of unknown function (DUF3854)
VEPEAVGNEVGEGVAMGQKRKSPTQAEDAIGSPLSDSDYAHLERRWIDRRVADAARLRRVDSSIGASYMGRKDNGSFAGLLIPYFLPGESRVREWRLRRDRPDIEDKDGKFKECRKYLSPPGSRNMAYFAPGMPAELFTAVETPVAMTEGELKTLALWRLANHESSAPRFVPIGLAGVWNWRGTVGKTTGPNGERCDVKGVIPDFDRVSWEGRRVTMAFDADANENEQVKIARNQLARELRLRGAHVGHVTWDAGQGKGIDDLIANVGPEKVLELLEGVDFERESDDAGITVSQIADAITSKHRFANSADGQLHIFSGGT